jgi:hypothetical protein
MVMVLEIGEFFFQLPLVVVVHDGKDPKPGRRCVLDVFFNEARADKIAEGFRSVPVACAFDPAIEAVN